ncbi:MAG: hypothetical protein R3271_01920 [Methylophaga sp.]|uniref:hypothetical protein n=1 Tax=Methylophaga sp. TaxID=2024840 RepID=UPI00299D2C02|nr:hypothetical protein [Methylophaga sp.]MDX1749060.1 hypothetical protein [Methylophaga sp.]
MDPIVPEELTAQFIEHVSNLLKPFYQDLKLKRKMNQQQKHRIKGFMFTGAHLGLNDKQELNELMEKVYFSVFGLIITERRLKSLKNEQEDIDGSFYDIPIKQRSAHNMERS